MRIRPARPTECDRLTAIAHAAKRHWGYPEEWIDLWKADLTYTPALLADLDVLVAELDEAEPIAGLVAVLCRGDEAAIEGLWVDPDRLGRGIGRSLLAAAVSAARAAGVRRVTIVSDPNAVGFYERSGARVVGWKESSPPGRMLPRLDLAL
jgi:ribosomal protein S18 acetylase RimI-like enzyme